MTREEFKADLVLYMCKQLVSPNLSKDELEQIKNLADFIYGA